MYDSIYGLNDYFEIYEDAELGYLEWLAEREAEEPQPEDFE